MRTYLADAETLDGLEFLSMSEAGEVIHLEILGVLGRPLRAAPAPSSGRRYGPVLRFVHVR